MSRSDSKGRQKRISGPILILQRPTRIFCHVLLLFAFFRPRLPRTRNTLQFPDRFLVGGRTIWPEILVTSTDVTLFDSCLRTSSFVEAERLQKTAGVFSELILYVVDVALRSSHKDSRVPQSHHQSSHTGCPRLRDFPYVAGSLWRSDPSSRLSCQRGSCLRWGRWNPPCHRG